MRRPRIFVQTPLRALSLPCLLILAVAATLGGCAESLSEDELQSLFDQGEFLCREARWEEARTVLREFLLYRPNHAGAHFYLGRAYLLSKDFRPAIAEGELQTALRLFVQGGRISPIERFGHDYFELICNVESAKVCLVQMDLMLALGAPRTAVQPLLERAERYAREADAAMPGTKDVKLLQEALSGFRLLRSPAFPKRRNALAPPAKA